MRQRAAQALLDHLDAAGVFGVVEDHGRRGVAQDIDEFGFRKPVIQADGDEARLLAGAVELQVLGAVLRQDGDPVLLAQADLAQAVGQPERPLQQLCVRGRPSFADDRRPVDVAVGVAPKDVSENHALSPELVCGLRPTAVFASGLKCPWAATIRTASLADA